MYFFQTRLRYEKFVTIKAVFNGKKLLLIASTTWFLAEGMFTPFLSIFSEQLGGNLLAVSWAWTTYLFVAGILYIFVGKLSDGRVNKKYLLVAGYSLNTFFTFSFLLVTSYWHLLLVQIGLGISVALATPTFNALYAKFTVKEEGGLAWGLYSGTSFIAQGLAMLVGGLIVSNFSYGTLFALMGCLQLFATLTLTPLLQKTAYTN